MLVECLVVRIGVLQNLGRGIAWTRVSVWRPRSRGHRL